MFSSPILGAFEMHMLSRRNHKHISKKEFCRQIDFAVELFRLDPTLQDIKDMKKGYANLANSRFPLMYWLQMLNPNYTVRLHTNDRLVIGEAPMGLRMIYIWSLIRHHVPDVSHRIATIVADGAGFHLYDNCYSEFVFVSGIPINPRRLADHGERYEYACRLINEFTGTKLDWRDLYGRTKTITVTKLADEWHVELDQLQPAD